MYEKIKSIILKKLQDLAFLCRGTPVVRGGAGVAVPGGWFWLLATSVLTEGPCRALLRQQTRARHRFSVRDAHLENSSTRASLSAGPGLETCGRAQRDPADQGAGKVLAVCIFS